MDFLSSLFVGFEGSELGFVLSVFIDCGTGMMPGSWRKYLPTELRYSLGQFGEKNVDRWFNVAKSFKEWKLEGYSLLAMQALLRMFHLKRLSNLVSEYERCGGDFSLVLLIVKSNGPVSLIRSSVLNDLTVECWLVILWWPFQKGSVILTRPLVWLMKDCDFKYPFGSNPRQ